MTKKKISAHLASFALGILGLAAAAPAPAKDWPSNPVTVVVGYAAGGPTDVLMRAMAPRLSEKWKFPVVVENRPGTNEIIAAQAVSKARPDGHTLMLSTEAPLTQNEHLYRKLPYDPKTDFSPVTHILTSPLALVVRPGVQANTVQEFIALAKSRSNTKPLAYGSAGAGGVLHLPMASFVKQNGLSMIHVPYKGLSPLINDLIGGQIDVAWMAVAAAAPHVQAGKLRALVVASPERSKAIPDVPIYKEVGVEPVQANFIFALVAPAETPLEIRSRIADDVREILKDPAFREKYLDPYGFVPVASTPAGLADYLAKDRVIQAERIKISGVTPE